MGTKLFTLLTIALFLTTKAHAGGPECDASARGRCYDPPRSLRLKLLAIASILVASTIGVCLPLFSRFVPALGPDTSLFMLVKTFASGVILATGYMHVLPDSFDDLRSPCLPRDPWAKFPFTTFVAMLSALVTLMIDSIMMARFNARHNCDGLPALVADHESPVAREVVRAKDVKEPVEDSLLVRHRIVAQVLEMGIVVHSVVIGLSMGASESPCTIRPLVAALCFHQLFEGMGLGGCILQAEYGLKTKATLAFFFATTTPFGIVLGIALSNIYSDNSPTALIVEGLLNACSAGLLHYMALVDLLAADFMGPKLQSSIKLQMSAFVAVLLGAGGMSLMAKWA